MSPTAEGLSFIAISALFALFFYLNLKSGVATQGAGLPAVERNRHAWGFWAIQAWMGFLSLACLLAALAIISGLSPP